MKLRYIVPFFMAVVASVLTSCSDDNDPTYLDEVRVSSSYVALPANGGSVTIDVNAVSDWSISDIPSWLTISPASGGAGVTQVTFTADKASATNEATVHLVCAEKTQNINVLQQTEKADLPISTCKEVIAGPDSKTYRVQGVCTSIANTTYGNWYLTDETGQVYIYGTLDAKGGTKNFLSLGIEEGDIVTAEGPKTTYNGTVELVDVTVIKIEKSLIKVDSLSTNEALPMEGGEVIAYVNNKGKEVSVETPDDAKDWLFISAVKGNAYTFRALPNTGGDRSTTVTFHTTDGKKDYTTQATINQKGAIIEVTVADFLAAAVGDTQYRISGIITDLYTSDKQGKSFYISDYTGQTLVYRAEGFLDSGAKVGDVVTVVGKRGAYKDSPQMVEGKLEEILYSVTPISIGDFRNVEDNSNKYYIISGTITEATESGTKNDVAQYGNFNLTDETGSVYVYGVLKGWGGAKGQFGELNLTWGDQLSIIAYKTTYKGLVEASGCIFLSGTPANAK